LAFLLQFYFGENQVFSGQKKHVSIKSLHFETRSPWHLQKSLIVNVAAILTEKKQEENTTSNIQSRLFDLKNTV